MIKSPQVRFSPHKRSLLLRYSVRGIQTAVRRTRDQGTNCTKHEKTQEALALPKGVGRRRREGFFSLVPSLHRVLPRDLLFNMADEGERNRLVAEFSGVTDVDVGRAQFYLESSGWDLNVSILVYFGIV